MGLLFVARHFVRPPLTPKGTLAGVLTAVSLAWLSVACGATTDKPEPDDTSRPPQQATSLTFVPGGVLKLLPLERSDISLAAGPPGAYPVRFALLPDRPNAEPNDASLDRAEAVTDSRGVSTVLLTAPSTPTTFTLRAAIGELEARLAVSVSDKGYGTIIAEPVYSGARQIDTWVASVRIGSSCADLVGFPPPDGALASSSDPGGSPLIDSVPVGPIAAVSVRSGQFAYGCTNVPDLGTDEIRSVQVEVADAPLQLAGELDLSLAVDDQGAEWTALLHDSVAASMAAFRGGATSDVQMLLDEMQALSPDPEEFAERRADHLFDEVVAAVLPDTTLSEHAQGWLEAGLTELGPLVGELELRNSSALFRLVSAAGVPAEESGFLGAATWSASSAPGDTLVLGGALRFQATQWAVALANAPALEQFTAAVDAAEALALVADCDLIGKTLAGAAEEDVSPDCDENCHLCEAAIVSAWARAGGAGGELTRLSIAVTGTVQVDAQARPASLTGSWLGTLAGVSSAVGGGAEAVQAGP